MIYDDSTTLKPKKSHSISSYQAQSHKSKSALPFLSSITLPSIWTTPIYSFPPSTGSALVSVPSTSWDSLFTLSCSPCLWLSLLEFGPTAPIPIEEKKWGTEGMAFNWSPIKDLEVSLLPIISLMIDRYPIASKRYFSSALIFSFICSSIN